MHITSFSYNLEDLKNRLKPDAPKLKEEGLCIECHLPAAERCYSSAGIREYFISGMCELCFDEMFKEEEEDYA